ncbi:hypothetical protein AB0E74_14505 [Streptomyces sp. NPDC030392]|uniref:hypothetical protein n=1 Tax=Streptomyces sp. NPDC030392 TaxID=3155468 RepID=UPI0033E9FF9F
MKDMFPGVAFRDKAVPPAKAARDVRLRARSRSTPCLVHRAPDGQTPLFSVEFVRPGHSDRWPGRPEPEDTYFRMGLDATADEDSAFIGFSCGKGVKRNGPPVVWGFFVMTAEGKALAKPPEKAAKGRAPMAVLHSATRSMARTLGCQEESGLPERVPEPSPHDTYREPPSVESLYDEFTREWKADGKVPGGAP